MTYLPKFRCGVVLSIEMKTLVELFQDRARFSSSARAVQLEDGPSISYAELDQASDLLRDKLLSNYLVRLLEISVSKIMDSYFKL